MVKRVSPMENGDIIRLQFDTYTEDGKLVDTTDEKKAKDMGIYDEHTAYKPMVTIIGSERLLKAVEESVKSSNVGEEKEIVLPPENAFGARDVNNIKVISYREAERAFKEQGGKDAVPEPGRVVKIGDKYGKVVTVTPGRVVVDFNHPLAGKKIKYVYKITEKIEKEEDKIRAIIEINFPKDVEKFKIETGEEIVITIPDSAKLDDSWPLAKFSIVGAVRQYIANKTIIFREVFEKRVEEKKEEKAEEKKEEEAKEIKTEN